MTGNLDPVTLQVLLASLRSTCEEMGAALVHAAFSANIKERRDASTALFDANGQMVMQAEHIPVHLGSMPDSVAAVLDRDHRPGDIYLLNDPFSGGTHLPDITLISPLYIDDVLFGFAASRAHHADVGGAVPASMPAESEEIYQEGLVIPPVHLMREGQLDTDILDLLLANMRNPNQREADLRAQIAANRIAQKGLEETAAKHGLDLLRDAMQEVLDYAERRTRASIEQMPDGLYTAEDVIEAGPNQGNADLKIRATVEVKGSNVVINFEGTAPQSSGNLNCPLSVTKSAAFFVLRVVTDPDIPPCAGSYRAIDVIAPSGTVVNATHPAAVAAGNVETSSRIADVILAAFWQALPVPAQGQGTMNNLTLGNRDFTYYETIGGGQGACPDADGLSAVHVAMSNTLNTPIEALELEYPLRVRRYEIRPVSGGLGAFRGGDGIVRELEAIEDMHYSLLTERRRHSPRGAAGGEDGQPGRNLLNGKELPGKTSGRLKKGDRLRIETPGGGGYGKANTGEQSARNEA